MPQTRAPTSAGPRLVAGVTPATPVVPMALATSTSTIVPMISLIRLGTVRRMAGAVQKQA